MPPLPLNTFEFNSGRVQGVRAIRLEDLGCQGRVFGGAEPTFENTLNPSDSRANESCFIFLHSFFLLQDGKNTRFGIGGDRLVEANHHVLKCSQILSGAGGMACARRATPAAKRAPGAQVR